MIRIDPKTVEAIERNSRVLTLYTMRTDDGLWLCGPWPGNATIDESRIVACLWALRWHPTARLELMVPVQGQNP